MANKNPRYELISGGKVKRKLIKIWVLNRKRQYSDGGEWVGERNSADPLQRE